MDRSTKLLDQLSSRMFALIQSMLQPVASERPPCVEILKDPLVNLEQKDGAFVQDLQQQLRQTTEVAEHERKLRANAEQKMASAEEKADRYWSELLHMKRLEMLRESSPSSAARVSTVTLPPPVRRCNTA